MAIFTPRLLKKVRLVFQPEKETLIFKLFPPEIIWGSGRIAFAAFLVLVCFSTACLHTPDALLEADKPTRIFEADEKIIVKAITRVLKDRGFGDPQVDTDKGHLETDFLTQGNWRTKVVTSVKKISRKEREVTLSIITEQKSFSQWQPKKIMGKEQYDKLFNEIDMQIYREWYKAE